MLDQDIIKKAKSVDEIITEDFRNKCRTAHLPKPLSQWHDDSEIYMSYSSAIDGRLIAGLFLDLLDTYNMDLTIARPPELAGFKVERRHKGMKVVNMKALRPAAQTDIASFARGNLRFINEQGITYFRGEGLVPATAYALLRTAQTYPGDLNHEHLYRAFAKSLGF
jgi:hypothetical protein